MRIFKSNWFQRFARKEDIGDSALREAVDRAQNGQIDADFGGEVLKQRIARVGQGKSKGYRAIILFRRDVRAFFVYGFSKSHQDSIDKAEERAFKEAAKSVLNLSDRHLAALIEKGDFQEVKANEQKISK